MYAIIHASIYLLNMIVLCPSSRPHQPILILFHCKEHNWFRHISLRRTTSSPPSTLQSSHRSLLKLGCRDCLYDGGDELLEEVQLEERRPEELDEVNYKTFDVRTVVILIGHNHEMTISKIFCAGVHCIVPNDYE